MKRLLFLLFAFLPLSVFAQRQEVEVRRIEGSISFGASFFEDNFYDSTAGEVGLLSSLELRYNFRRGEKVSYFVGAGVGATFYNADTTKLCFMPRVGMEFFNRLRLTMAYMAGPNAKNTLNLTLGVAIGGGRKK